MSIFSNYYNLHLSIKPNYNIINFIILILSVLRHLKSQIYLTHDVRIASISNFKVFLLNRAIFILTNSSVFVNVHHWNPPLFKLRLQYWCHLPLIFRTWLLILVTIGRFTIIFEVVHQLWLHLLFTLLLILALPDFFLDILHNYWPF
jgi:hypothetical protein